LLDTIKDQAKDEATRLEKICREALLTATEAARTEAQVTILKEREKLKSQMHEAQLQLMSKHTDIEVLKV
jgi:hypothetical protein